MKFLLNLLPFTLLPSLIQSVNRAQFKTCAQSGFCTRQRAFADRSTPINWTATSPSIDGRKVKFEISNPPDNHVKLEATLQFFEGGIFRFLVDERNREQRRYRIPDNDVILVNDLHPLAVEFASYSDGFDIKAKEWGTVLASIKASPFELHFMETHGSGKRILSANTAGLFNWESKRGPLTETYQQWTDPQAHGLQSIGLDLVFEGSTDLIGLPEHASSLSLKATKSRVSSSAAFLQEPTELEDEVLFLENGKEATNSDPYRLYNLDVFEYELDSPMALYGSIPFMMGMEDGVINSFVGVFWNNPSETWVDIYEKDDGTNGRTVHFMSEAGIIDLFVFTGPQIQEVIQQYYEVTGRPYFPPLFSLGYHQCRWNYMNQTDLLNVNKELDKHEIPADVLWLDIEHTDGKRYLTWDKEAFPDPTEMQKELGDRKLVVIVDPHIKKDPDYFIYSELEAKPDLCVKTADSSRIFEGHCWPGNSIWPDFTNPETRGWWSNKIAEANQSSSYSSSTFIWNDMNEPSVFSGPEVTMPKDVKHFQNVEQREVHNLYGYYMQKATFEGLLGRSQDNVRPFVLTRAIYAGSQRFGAKWTGDNKSDWKHLMASVPMLLSLSVAGMPFVGADVGGFFGNPEPELLARWYQLGAFQPFFRAHAHIDTLRREPWLIPEPFQTYIKKAIRLRYQLLPHIYRLFRESAEGSKPPMRPLFMEFPDEKGLLAIEDQFMLGESIMVKAIGQREQKVCRIHFPKGADWYDFYTHELMNPDNDGNIDIDVYADKIPTFVRSGSIVVKMEKSVRSSADFAHMAFALFIYTTEDHRLSASTTLYIDDGVSIDYTKGQYVKLLIKHQNERLTWSMVNHLAEKLGINVRVDRIVIAGEEEPHEVHYVKELGTPKRTASLKFAKEGNLLVIYTAGVNFMESGSIYLKFDHEDL